MKPDCIIAHRGLWHEPTQKNAPSALIDAMKHGFGIETDFRDMAGTLYVSHDPVISDAQQTAAEFFQTYSAQSSTGRLALNIKADGLQQMLINALAAANIDHKFVYAFDMAVPDALGYLNADFPCFTRVSEYESDPSFIDRAKGVWVDNFTGDYPQIKRAQQYMNAGKRVAIVSPELHGRDHNALWDEIHQAKLHQNPLFEICTDYPVAALKLFGT